MERVAWTDDRIDDAMTRIDRGFELMREEMREFRTDMREMRVEMREMRTDLHGQIAAGQRQMTMIGWGIAAAMLAQLIAFVVT